MDAEQVKSATRRVKRATVRLVKDEAVRAVQTPLHTTLLLVVAVALGLFISIIYTLMVGGYV